MLSWGQVLSVYEAISLCMAYSSGKVAGALFFIAVTQFVLGLIVSEALFSGYSISGNYISDLGVGSSSMIFNSSVFLMGLLLIVGAYFLQLAGLYIHCRHARSGSYRPEAIRMDGESGQQMEHRNARVRSARRVEVLSSELTQGLRAASAGIEALFY